MNINNTGNEPVNNNISQNVYKTNVLNVIISKIQNKFNVSRIDVTNEIDRIIGCNNDLDENDFLENIEDQLNIIFSNRENHAPKAPINVKNIPEEMKKLNQWVLRKQKIPYQVNGHEAKSNDPSTWNTFIQVMSIADQFDGIGFEFSKDNDIMGVDFDHVYENGVWNQEVLEEILSLNSYAEMSPSGTGAHVIVKAHIPKGTKKGNREMYESDRYFTVTGNHIEGTPLTINQSQEAVDILYQKWFSKSEPDKTNKIQKSENSVSISVSDAKIIEIAFKAKNGEKFKALYEGDSNGYSSHSEADLAFCSLIAFYTQDKAQIDSIFKSSGLYREKWNRADYRDKVIDTAISGLSAKYDWNKKSDEIEVVIDIDNFKFTITFDKKYYIKIQDKNVLFPCNKPLNEYNASRDKQLIEFIVNQTKEDEIKIDKTTAKTLVDKLGVEITGDYFVDIVELKSSKQFKELLENDERYLERIVPYPYTIEDENLYIKKLIKNGDDYDEIKEYVSRAFTIKSYGEIKDKGDCEGFKNVVLEFRNIDHNTITKTVDVNNILDPNSQKENLQVLAIVGLKRAEFINYYLSVVENNVIPIAEITKIGGWKDNFTRYVSGDATYGEGKEYGLINNYSMENVHKKGTFNDWIEGTYELLNDDVYAFVNYTGVCSLIQQYLGIPNFNILYISKTSIGKSTSGRVRSSGFGHPHHMMTTSNASKQGIPNVIYAYNDVPCHLDEIKDDDVPMVKKFLYDFSSGQKRIRANKNGGVNDTKNELFTTNILCTTEQPILDVSAKGGENARVIIIRKAPKVPLSAVTKFEDNICNKNGIAKTYGHCLELYIPKIIQMIENGSLKSRFDEIKKELQTINTRNSNMVNRFVEYYAGIALAGEIFNETVVKHPENRDRIKALNPVEITKQFMQDHVDEEPDKSEGERAMEVFMDWYNGNRLKFNEPPVIKFYDKDSESMDEREQTNEFYGYNTDKEVIQVFIHKLKDVLKKANFKYETILGEWKEEGYIRTRGNKNTCQKKYTTEHQKIAGKQNFPCVEIIKNKVQDLLINSENNENSNNTIISDFCKDKLIIGNTIIDATLKEVYQSYAAWCKDNSIIPMNIALFFGAFISTNKNVAYDQTDANDMNSIIFQCVGLRDLNIYTPKKLHISLDDLEDNSVQA